MATEIKAEPATARHLPECATPLISDDKLKQLYSAMLQCRTLQERRRALAKRRNLLQAAAVGQQEAILAGVAMDLRPEDTIAPSYGSVIADFVKGMPLEITLNAIDRLLPASSTGKPRPASSAGLPNSDSSNAMISAPESIAAQLSIAAGLALAHKLRKSGNVVVVFANGRWASRNAGDEALRFAGAHGLPIIFVVEDSRGAGTGSRRSPIPDRARVPIEDYGFPSIPVDGNDLVALYRVAHEAIKRARLHGGPTLMDCKLFRCGQFDDDRSETDPVMRMERYLAARKLFSADWKRQMVRAFKAELDAASSKQRKAHR